MNASKVLIFAIRVSDAAVPREQFDSHIRKSQLAPRTIVRSISFLKIK